MSNYSILANAYAEGALGLMMPARAAASHVSQRGVSVMPFNQLARQARQLSTVSAQLTHAGAVKLTSSNPHQRIEAQYQLLAKALSDLTISQQLLDAADDEKLGVMPQIAHVSRSASMFDIDNYLKVVTSGFPARFSSRAAAALDVSSARFSLNDEITRTLAGVLDQTAIQGQAAFKGLVGVGLYNLGRAAGVVGGDIARYLGYGAQVSELYGLVNDYIGRAHETILTLLGHELSAVAVEKAMDFFGNLKDGSLLTDLLEKIYETGKTRDELLKMVQDSASELPNFNKAIEGLSQLSEQFKGIMEFVGKLTKGLKFVGMVPAAALPQAQLVMSASHAVLFTYVVLAGADFADAKRVKLLNRVPGVRDLISSNLLQQG